MTGVIAGVACSCWSKLLVRLGIDDPVDAVAVHLGGGLWGALARALFETDGGVFAAFSNVAWKRFGAQLGWACIIVAWTLGTCAPVLLLMKRFGVLRVSALVEADGIDHHMHGEGAVPTEVARRRALADLMLDRTRRSMVH